tara:strand:+ start:21493 stop:22932 length:1440 start_codon:yes stop_codon:yes gene_type:complete
MIFINQIKNIIDDSTIIHEANKDLKMFDENKFNDTKYASRNQAKQKIKMAGIDIGKNASDLLVPAMLIYMTYDFMSGNPTAPVVDLEGLTALSQETKVVYDYIANNTPKATPIITSIAALSYSVISQLKNPSELRFYSKEKEQAKILKEFFKNDYLMQGIEESNILMMGYCFSDALKRCKGVDRKVMPLALMRMGGLFNPSNDLSHYNKSNSPEDKEFSSVYKFTRSLLDEPELEKSLDLILQNKKEGEESFTKREQVKYLSEKMEKSFSTVYKEIELEKTASITLKMLSKANGNEESFLKLYKSKVKPHFENILNNELPPTTSEPYKKMFRELDTIKEKIESGGLTEEDRLENRSKIKEIFNEYNIGSKKSVLDRVRESYVEIVKTDALNVNYDLTKSNKHNTEIKKSFKEQNINKKEKKEKKLNRLINLIEGSMLRDEKEALELMEIKEAINPSKENKEVIDSLRKQTNNISKKNIK